MSDAAMERQEAAEAQRRARMQDKEVPMLINIHDHRLMPNVELIKLDPNYRPYHGNVHATLEERRRYVEGVRMRSVQLEADPEPFNLGKATKEELIAFAIDEYGITLDGKKDRNTLAAEVFKLAESAGVVVAKPGKTAVQV